MGTFVEDYIHSDNSFLEAILNAENIEDIQTEKYEDILVAYRDQATIDKKPYTLDKFNGRVCNTPDFPKELYPDGVYCYFLTTDDNEDPVFPYIMGKTFRDRPISQNVNINDSESLTPISYKTVYNPVTYEDPFLTFDFTKVDRHRDPLLTETKEGVELEMSNVTSGSVSDIVVNYGGPERTRVGDLVYFNNEGTSGTGASAIVTYLKGEDITNAEGKGVFTYVTSKRFRLDLSYNVATSYVFTPGSYVEMTSGSLAIVEKYEQDKLDINGFKYLTIRIVNNIAPTPTDTFYDNKGKAITLPGYFPIIVRNPTIAKAILEQADNEYDLLSEDGVHYIMLEGDSTVQYTIPNPYVNGIVTEAEEGEFQIMAFDDLTHFFVDDEIYLSSVLPLGENIRIVEKIEPNQAKLDISGLTVPNGTVCENKTRSFFEITTATPHRLRVGDEIIIENSIYPELNKAHKVCVVTDEFEFKFYVSQDYGPDNDLVYFTSGERCEHQAGKFRLVSGGIGYKKLPKIEGLIKHQGHRAETLTHVEGTSISSVEILRPGARYDSPIAVFIDLAGRGTGAKGRVVVADGVVVEVVVLEGGQGYEEPILYIVEPTDMIPLTNNIGEIKSMRVLNPGRAISADRSLKPEIKVTERFIVNTTDDFQVNETVYQGTPELYQAYAIVEDWNPDNKVLSLTAVTGNFKKGEVNGIYGGKGDILVNGQSQSSVVVSGLSEMDGFFIDDTSKVSEKYPVIQDSYYYQWFSYVIHSSMQKNSYNSFVQSIIHPSGFIDFAELSIHDRVESPARVDDVVIDGFSTFIAIRTNDDERITVEGEDERYVDISNK